MITFLLSIVPATVFHLVIIFSVLSIVLSLVFPVYEPYKKMIQIIAIALLAISIFFEGAMSNDKVWRLRVADAEKQVEIVNKNSAIANSHLTSIIADQQIQMERMKSDTNMEIERLKESINGSCSITDEAKGIVNRSIKKRSSKK